MVYAEVSVPQKFHPHVIGKKGANINRIKEETCTSISIPSDKEKSDIIRIEGDPQGVAAAKMIITDMMAKLVIICYSETCFKQETMHLSIQTCLEMIIYICIFTTTTTSVVTHRWSL